MHLITITTGLLFIALTTGCGDADKKQQAANNEAFNTQQNALNNAKQVEGIVLDAAAQQQKTIEQDTK